MLKRYGHLFFVIAVICDAAAVAAAWMIAYVIKFRLGLLPILEPVPPEALVFIRLLPIVLVCSLLALGFVGLYSPTRTRSLFREALPIAKGSILGWLGTLAALYYFYRTTLYSRELLAIFLFLSPPALIASRALVRRVMKALYAHGLGTQSAGIIGAGRRAQELFRSLQANPWLGLRVVYFVDEEARSEPLCGLPVLGSFSKLIECMRENPVDTVFVAIPHRNAERLEGVLDTLAKLPLTVAVVPDFSGAITLNSSVAEIEGLPVIQLRDTPITGWHALAKRALDFVGSIILLALFGLPMLMLTLLVRVSSPGPVLFKQERMGLGGRPFTLLKFRTMRADAECETGPVWAKENDPRRTLIGSWMRRLSLDELPQFINILRGDMSLVGPRPERLHFVRQFTQDLPAYMLRHNVKAGLTGWAQVNGLRGNTSLTKRLEYDLYYINNWSLAFDVLILLLTPFMGLINRNAY
jgi:exopolysaccharide biosynthesis polyprenyl glycosylphosphotransferase